MSYVPQKNCGLCSYSLSFSMPLICTLLAVNISHFHTITIKFLCCIFNEICLLCFSSLALVLLCYPLQPRRLNFVEKETALLFFFLSKRLGDQDDFKMDVCHYQNSQKSRDLLLTWKEKLSNTRIVEDNEPTNKKRKE